MRNKLLIAAFILSPIFSFGQAPFNTAVEYNDFIVNEQNLVGEAINDLMSNMLEDSITVWAHYNAGLIITKNCFLAIQNAPAYENNTYFRDASIELFQFYLDVFSNEFRELITYYTDPNISFEKLDEELNRISEAITLKEDLYDNNFANAQAQFAEEYHFNLLDIQSDEDEF